MEEDTDTVQDLQFPIPEVAGTKVYILLKWKNAGQSEVLRFMRIITIILCLGIGAG